MTAGICLRCGARAVVIVLPIVTGEPAEAECRNCKFTLELPGPASEWSKQIEGGA